MLSLEAIVVQVLPSPLSPVLARVQHLNSLSTSSWWEVVYFDDETRSWCAFAGSKTFEDGEVVKGWIYCDGLENTKGFISVE